MQKVIYYEERITMTNSITIEVDDEGYGEMIENSLASDANDWNHPDDIFDALREFDVKILERCQGAESVEYEIV